MIFNPRTPKLWVSIYSPDPDLQSKMNAKPARKFDYDLTRWVTSIPEFEECEGTTLSTCNLYRLEVLRQEGVASRTGGVAHKRKKLATLAQGIEDNKSLVSSKFKVGLVLKEPSEVSGESVGFMINEFDPEVKLDPKLLVVQSADGSRPLRVVKTAGNACLLEVADSCLQRQFEVQGQYLHVYDVLGIWEDEQQQFRDSNQFPN